MNTKKHTKNKMWKQELDLPTNSANSCYVNSVLIALLLPTSSTGTFVRDNLLFGVLQVQPDPSKRVFDATDSRADLRDRRRVQRILVKLARSFHNGRLLLQESKHEEQQLSVPRCNLQKRSCNAEVDLLRGLLSTSRNGMNFADGQQHDAAEFLSTLLSVFAPSLPSGVALHTVHGSNDLLAPKYAVQDLIQTSARKDEYAGLVWRVSTWEAMQETASMLYIREDDVLADGFAAKDGVHYLRRISEAQFSPHDMCILHIDRAAHVFGDANQLPNRTPLRVNTEINGGKHMLVAAVLHDGIRISSGHYTTLVFKGDGQVLHFDDLLHDDPLILVTIPPKQVLEVLAERATLLFYASSADGQKAM